MRLPLKRLLIGRRSLRRFLLLPLAVYAALCLYAFFFADSLLFRPPAPSYRTLPGAVPLRTADGTPVYAVFLEAPASRRTVLYSHGNAEDLGSVYPALALFRQAGYSVLAYDYEGYGRSGGAPSESACERDIEAAYAWLVNDRRLDPADILVYGHSLGSGPSLYLATRHPVGGLVLEGAFTSAFRVLTRWSVLPFDRFPNLSRVSRVRCPVLVVHGTRDAVIGFHHGEALFAAAPFPKRFLPVAGAGHNDLLPGFGERVLAVMREMFPPAPPASAGGK